MHVRNALAITCQNTELRNQIRFHLSKAMLLSLNPVYISWSIVFALIFLLNRSQMIFLILIWPPQHTRHNMNVLFATATHHWNFTIFSKIPQRKSPVSVLLTKQKQLCGVMESRTARTDKWARELTNSSSQNSVCSDLNPQVLLLQTQRMRRLQPASGGKPSEQGLITRSSQTNTIQHTLTQTFPNEIHMWDRKADKWHQHITSVLYR